MVGCSITKRTLSWVRIRIVAFSYCALTCVLNLFVCLFVACNCVEFPARRINKPRPGRKLAWGQMPANQPGGLLLPLLLLLLFLLLAVHLLSRYQCQQMQTCFILFYINIIIIELMPRQTMQSIHIECRT